MIYGTISNGKYTQNNEIEVLSRFFFKKIAAQNIHTATSITVNSASTVVLVVEGFSTLLRRWVSSCSDSDNGNSSIIEGFLLLHVGGNPLVSSLLCENDARLVKFLNTFVSVCPPLTSSSSRSSERSSGCTLMSRTARNWPQLFRCSFSSRKKFQTNLRNTSITARTVLRMWLLRNFDPPSPTEKVMVHSDRNMRFSTTARMYQIWKFQRGKKASPYFT